MYEEMINLVSNVVFPIAMAIILMAYIYKMEERHTKQLESVEENHNKINQQLFELISNNTEAIERLSDNIERRS